jgi:hypothetical protein
MIIAIAPYTPFTVDAEQADGLLKAHARKVIEDGGAP